MDPLSTTTMGDSLPVVSIITFQMISAAACWGGACRGWGGQAGGGGTGDAQ